LHKLVLSRSQPKSKNRLSTPKGQAPDILVGSGFLSIIERSKQQAARVIAAADILAATDHLSYIYY